jgi:hypothetical protein
MTTHNNICANNCGFAIKSVLLSYAGTQGEYLHRCTKIDRIITTDSALFQVGCATYISGTQQSKQEEKLVQGDSLLRQAQDLLKEINQQIKEIQPEATVPVQELVITVPEPAVQKPVEPVVTQVTVPVTKQTPLETVASAVIPEESLKKKRGRPPKQATITEPVKAETTKHITEPEIRIAIEQDAVQIPAAISQETPIQKPAVLEIAAPTVIQEPPLKKKRGRPPKQVPLTATGTTAPTPVETVVDNNTGVSLQNPCDACCNMGAQCPNDPQCVLYEYRYYGKESDNPGKL